MATPYTDAVLNDSPLLYWHLDETSGTTATDASPNSRPGTYNASPTLGAQGLVDDGGAVTLNGTSHYISRASESALNFAGTAAMSLECWVKFSTIDAGFRRLFSRENTTADGYFIYMNLTDGLRFERDVAAGGGNTIGNWHPNVGDWHHVVATYDGTNMRFYIDGVLNAGPTGSAGSMLTFTQEFDVGRNSKGGDFTVGTVDEVAVYNTALSAARVALHYSLAFQRTLNMAIPPSILLGQPFNPAVNPLVDALLGYSTAIAVPKSPKLLVVLQAINRQNF